MAKKSMDKWIHEAMTDTDKEGKISVIALVHHVGSAEREVHAIRFASKQWESKDAAKLLRDKAETYAQELPGVQQFSLLAFYTRNEPEARYPFTISGELDFGGLATEGPTGSGLTQQAMRHSEAVIQMAFRQMGTMADAANAMIRQLSEREAKVMTENHSLLELVKSLLLERGQTHHEARMRELEHERATEERRKMIGIMPALVNSIAGHDVFPAQTADSAILESIAEHLDEEKVRKLAEILPPELWGPLAARFTEFVQTRNKRLETGKNLLEKGLRGEDDAAGDISQH